MKKLLTLALLCLTQLSQAASKPNVIYIIADDLGYGDLSVYGQTNFTTPNIDALAKKGMLFKQHYPCFGFEHPNAFGRTRGHLRVDEGFYNHPRFHSALGCQSPVDFENQLN